MMKRFVVSLVLVLMMLSVGLAQKAKPFTTEGTFSNIKMGSGGDYGGMRIYLTDSDGQFYATVTIAEGVLMAPVLVKVQANVEKRQIEFTLPNENGERRFKGTVSAGGLTLWEGQTKTFLKRKCG